MKRRVFFELDAFYALFITVLMTALLSPALWNMNRLIKEISYHTVCTGEAVFAGHLITENMRNQDERSSVSHMLHSDSWSYSFKSDQEMKRHAFLIDREKLKIQFSDGQRQPVTGESDQGNYEICAFRSGDPSFFTIYDKGLISFSYRITWWMGAYDYEIRSSVLSYADYFKTGEEYDP